jgi:hypothetical protein
MSVPSVEMTGLVQRPGTIGVEDLERLRVQTLTVEFQSGGRPARMRTFRGVWLIDAINLRRPTVEGDDRYDRLARCVVVTASDGARVAFSMGELDRSIGSADVLLCWRVDDQVLEAFRLVVASDASRVRSIAGVASIAILRP